MKKKYSILTFLYFLNLSFESSCYSQNKFSFWGDSFTQGAGGSGENISEKVRNNLGVKVYNFGNGGFNSTQIACLQGGLSLELEFDNNKIIPKSQGNTIITNLSISVFNSTSVNSRLGKLNGIPGKIIRVPNSINPAITDRIEFKRKDIDSEYEIILSGNKNFVFDNSIKHKDNINIIWVGRNDIRTLEQETIILDNIEKMIDFSTSKKFIIISIINSTDETKDTFEFNNINNINDKLKYKYGINFLDLRNYMVNEAIHEKKIIPTSNDIESINNQIIPQRFLYDHIHFNDLGYSITGDLITKKIIELGYN